jgi:hypothetical protein
VSSVYECAVGLAVYWWVLSVSVQSGSLCTGELCLSLQSGWLCTGELCLWVCSRVGCVLVSSVCECAVGWNGWKLPVGLDKEGFVVAFLRKLTAISNGRMVRCGKDTLILFLRCLYINCLEEMNRNTVKPQYSSCNNCNWMFSCYVYTVEPLFKILQFKFPLLPHLFRSVYFQFDLSPLSVLNCL